MEKWLLDLDKIFNLWMYPFGKGPDKGYLNREGRIINDKLGDALRDNQRVLIGHYCIELETYARSNYNSQEIAEVLAICARVKTSFGELDQAENWLREARTRYTPNDHCKAIVSMMMGSLLWRLPGRQEEAIGEWAKCEKSFIELRKSDLIEEDRVDWYRQQIAKINELITWASHVLSRRNVPWKNFAFQRIAPRQGLGQVFKPMRQSQVRIFATSAPQAVPASQAAPGKQAGPAHQEPPLTWTDLFGEDYVSVYKISASVPAGGFQEVGGDPHPVGELHVPVVSIDGRLHRIVNLRKRTGHEINLINVINPSVVRVIGGSMYEYPILDGDYVQLNSQLEPKSGEIVLVKYINPDTAKSEESIKILRVEPDRIVLQSMFENQKVPTEWRSFLKADLESGKEQLEIIAVVLARYTPLPILPPVGGY